MGKYFETHNRVIDYTNKAYIKPRFFIPKTKISDTLIARFQASIDNDELPYISYDHETRLFVLHGFENDATPDDCMNLILKFQLVPLNHDSKKGAGAKRQNRMLYYIIPGKLNKFQNRHYKGGLSPIRFANTSEYDNLYIKASTNMGLWAKRKKKK